MGDAGADDAYMRRAIQLSEKAMVEGTGPPFGAVIVRDGRILAEGFNNSFSTKDPTAHAEIVALRRAGKALRTSRLDDCDLWVTLEPCAMCAAAIGIARIRRLYFAADDPKGGAVLHGPRLYTQPTCHHRPVVYAGIGEEQSAALLRGFFTGRR